MARKKMEFKVKVNMPDYMKPENFNKDKELLFEFIKVLYGFQFKSDEAFLDFLFKDLLKQKDKKEELNGANAQ